ncbi:MAG: type II toxin-antitoxin system VapC family toxin [Methylococcales bacterium]
MIFIDTNMVIEYLKDNAFFKGYDFEELFINDIVIMELYQGARNKQDLAFIKKEIAVFQILNTHQEIINLAKQIVEKYGLSHNMKIMDALIAATAMVYDLELMSLNRKYFQFLPQLKMVELFV